MSEISELCSSNPNICLQNQDDFFPKYRTVVITKLLNFNNLEIFNRNLHNHFIKFCTCVNPGFCNKD